MASLADQLSVLVSGALFLGLLAYIAARRPVLLFAFLFILITLAWRTVATMYIDLNGPVYSSQTFRFIGPGTATVVHVLAYTLTVLPFLLVLRPQQISNWAQKADTRPSPECALTLSDVTYFVSAVFVGWLFLDLARIGVVPLLAKMERFTYTWGYAGAAHAWLIKYGNLFCFWLGAMFAVENLRNNRFDARYLTLMFVLFAYVLLTGNRFSAFYSFGSFFVMPLAAVIAVKFASRPAHGAFSWVTSGLGHRERAIVVVILAALCMAVIAGLYNNLVNVRGYVGASIWDHFLERGLIQPSELGWISYERVFLLGYWNPGRTFDFLFVHPIDATRNTTPQFLMLETIGEPRTSEHILSGFQFAGGFPEIFFELFGPYLAWPFILGAGWMAAGLTGLFVRSLIEGRYATAFLTVYVLFGFLVMYIGGMLNFVLVWTYWVKLAALGLATVSERALAQRGLVLLPWIIMRRAPLAGMFERLRGPLSRAMPRA